MISREIKFRFWHVEQKRFYIANTLESISLIGKLAGGIPLNWMEHQQFIGLRDKDGEDIYEGDILYIDSPQYPEITPYTSMVEWSDVTCGWGITPIGYFNIKIIGNIFENPELIK